MSTNFITFHPATLSTACAAARRKPDPNNNIRSTSWFTPLFGWPNTPDYINSVAPDLTADPEPVAADPVTKSKKFVLGKFTDEKAKQLRMMTTGKDAFLIQVTQSMKTLGTDVHRETTIPEIQIKKTTVKKIAEEENVDDD